MVFRGSITFVDVSAVGNADDGHNPIFIRDGIDNTPSSYSNPIYIFVSLELFAPRRSGIFRQR